MAKSLHLGLEALQLTPTVNGGAEISIDLVDAVIRVNSASEAIQMELFEGERLMTAFENLCSIDAEIKKNGVSKALEALVGENFGGTVSQEAVGETLKRWWTAIVEWFKRMWAKIKQFFTELFDRNEKWQRVLTEEVQRVKNLDVDDAKFGETEYSVVDIPAKPTAAAAKEYIEAKAEPKKVKFTKATALERAGKILTALHDVKSVEPDGNKLFEDAIKYAQQNVNKADAADAEAAKKEVAELQQKASDYTKAVTEYGKRVNECASQMVKILKAAPAKAKPAENK